MNRPELPPELVQFYTANEAVEFEGLDYGSIYLHPLDEVTRVGWTGLGFDAEHCPNAWKGFDAFHIGGGCCFEKITYVVNAPCCQPSAILAFGSNLPAGGAGDHGADGCLVLAGSLSEWLARLEQEGWWEYAIGGGISELPLQRQLQHRTYYLALNPNMDWPEP